MTVQFVTVQQGIIRAFHNQVFFIFSETQQIRSKVMKGNGNLFEEVIRKFVNEISTSMTNICANETRYENDNNNNNDCDDDDDDNDDDENDEVNNKVCKRKEISENDRINENSSGSECKYYSVLVSNTNIHYLAESGDKPFDEDKIIKTTQDSMDESQNNLEVKQKSSSQINEFDNTNGGL